MSKTIIIINGPNLNNLGKRDTSLYGTKTLDDIENDISLKASIIGVEVKFLSPDQVKEIWPLCNTEGLIGAIQHPEDGYIQPADLT